MNRKEAEQIKEMMQLKGEIRKVAAEKRRLEKRLEELETKKRHLQWDAERAQAEAKARKHGCEIGGEIEIDGKRCLLLDVTKDGQPVASPITRNGKPKAKILKINDYYNWYTKKTEKFPRMGRIGFLMRKLEL